jgi:hypothetical protein
MRQGIKKSKLGILASEQECQARALMVMEGRMGTMYNKLP